MSARTAHRSGREHEDLVAAVGQFADGTVTSHLVNWLSPLKECGTRRSDLPCQWAGREFVGRGAAFRGVSEGDMIRYAIAKPEPLRTEQEQFRDAVLGLDADIVTMEQAMHTVRAAEAMLRADAGGSVIAL